MLIIQYQKRLLLKERSKPSQSFAREIRCMMYAFGDSKEPLWESVLYVEKILRQQMNLLLSKAADVAKHRKGSSICQDDLLFLLKKNKVKLKRLLSYLGVKDATDVLSKPSRLTELVVQRPADGKSVKACLNFLNKIDSASVFKNIMDVDIPDPALKSRNERKYALVSSISDEEYFEFSEILKVSFFPKGGEKTFLEWLMEDQITDLIPTKLALEIINYLARETIYEIVDYVILTRQEKNSLDSQLSSPNQNLETNTLEYRRRYSLLSASHLYEKCAITVEEIQDAVQRFGKDTSKRYSLHNEYSMPFPNRLLCC